MKHVLRVINVLATVVILVAFVVLLRTVFTPAGEIPTIMGYGFMRTLTGSMEPAIPVHSFIVVDTDNSQAYQVGDIITFHSSDDALEGSLNTHRIVAVEDAADGTPVYRTKGDANPVEDAAPVPAADVVGRVVFVSAGLGVVVSLLTNPLLFFPLIVVPLIVLLAGQTLFMILYVVLVVFNIMGRDYDAAVIVSGTCGFGMGATPNAMANMQALCEKYAPSVKAYLLIPLVGSLFADFINSLVTTFFINFI